MGELEQLLRAGGARWLLAAVVRDMRARMAANGGRPRFPVEVERLLRILEAYTGDVPIMSDVGPSGSTLRDMTTGMKPAAEAAKIAGCSARHARRLAQHGRVRSVELNARMTLIDVDGLVSATRARPQS